MATRFLWGVIFYDGTIWVGSGGFSVTRQTAGRYVIIFDPPFPHIPAIVGSQVNWGNDKQNTLDNVVFPVVNVNLATALTGATDGSHVDRNFSFIAVGEPNIPMSPPTCVSGAINKDGSIVLGSKGFNVLHQGPGEYYILFDPPLPVMPAIVGKQTNWGDTSENTLDNVVFPSVTNLGAMALTGATDGNHVDRSFSFIAVAPA